MPNRAYNRSVRRERELVNSLRANGWDACRSAGSKSPWDVWAVHRATGRCCVYQIKTKIGSRKEVRTLIDRQGQTEFWWISWE